MGCGQSMHPADQQLQMYPTDSRLHARWVQQNNRQRRFAGGVCIQPLQFVLPNRIAAPQQLAISLGSCFLLSAALFLPAVLAHTAVGHIPFIISELQ